jgi:4-amino-4-deoxy-L-arabinose transferase-like glycosyltransferase
VFVFLVMILMMPATSLWDRDEPLYARAAVEMVQSGSFIVPTFNGEVFAHKPPLMYWLMGLGIRVFGVNEFAVRLVSAFGMAGTGWLTFLIGRRMFNPRVGFWAMVMVLTAAMSLCLGAGAFLDAVLLCWITLAVWAFIELLYRPGRWPVLTPIFGIALMLSLLTKGPVGPVVVGSMVVVTTWLVRKELPLKWTHYIGLAVAAIISFTVFLAWAIPANHASGGEMEKTGFGVHILERAFRPMEGHGGSGIGGYLATLLLYVPVVVIVFFPWTLHLPAGLSALMGRRIGTPRERAILWAWMGPTFVMFSLVATKLPHYIFPLFPALALTVAAGIDAHRREQLVEKDRQWFRRGTWFFGAVIFGAGLALLIVPWFFIPSSRAAAALPAGVVYLVLGTIVVRAQRRQRIEWVNRVLLVSSPLMIVLTYWTVLPQVERLIKISPDIASAVRFSITPETPVYIGGYTEPSLVFYLNRPVGNPVRKLSNTPDEVARVLAEAPSLLLVSTEKHFALASRIATNPPIRELARFEAINVNVRARKDVVIVSGRGIPAGKEP